jgi:hypothetical protein
MIPRMAEHLNPPCRVMGLREGTPARHGVLSEWRHVGRESGATAMSLRVLDALPGTSPGLLNGDCEQVLFVLGAAARPTSKAGHRPWSRTWASSCRPGPAWRSSTRDREH